MNSFSESVWSQCVSWRAPLNIKSHREMLKSFQENPYLINYVFNHSPHYKISSTIIFFLGLDGQRSSFSVLDSWVLSHLTRDLSQAEKKINVVTSWANQQNDISFTQNGQSCQLISFMIDIFVSAWDKSCVKWDNSRNENLNVS